MTRSQAKELAFTVTPEQIKAMLLNAQNSIKDWTKASSLNKGLSLGKSFNIFSNIEFNDKTHWLIKRNALVTFGDYLPGYVKPVKEKRVINVYHEEPNFLKNERL